MVEPLEHVYDLKSRKCVVDVEHCCYYSPAIDRGDVRLSSSNPRVVSVDGGSIVCEGRGSATVTLHYSDILEREDASVTVVVYKNNLPDRNRTWGNVVLPVNTVVDIYEVLKHGVCPNCMSCIWDSREFKLYDYNKSNGLIDARFNYKRRLKGYRKALEEYSNNGVITYIDELDNHYNISKVKGDDGKTVVEVTVDDEFVGALKHKIKEVEIELREITD